LPASIVLSTGVPVGEPTVDVSGRIGVAATRSRGHQIAAEGGSDYCAGTPSVVAISFSAQLMFEVKLPASAAVT
jgi:hypothetical protein